MGIGKTIEAFGISNLYTSDTKQFLSQLPTTFNYEVTIYDIDYCIVEEYKMIHQNTDSSALYLTVEINLYKENEDPLYTITVPIKTENESKLNFIFYKNQLVQIQFLTFEHLWLSFLQCLYNYQDFDIFLQLRKEYKYWCKILGIDSLLIFSDHLYKFEAFNNDAIYPHFNQTKELITLAQKLDKVHCLHLPDLLTTNINQERESFMSLLHCNSKDIILCDKLED